MSFAKGSTERNDSKQRFQLGPTCESPSDCRVQGPQSCRVDTAVDE